MKKNKDNKDYELLTSFVIEIEKLRDENLEALLSGYKISEFVLQNIKKDKLPKKFEQDLSNANFDDFQQEELEILGKITKSMKLKKNRPAHLLKQVLEPEDQIFKVPAPRGGAPL